MKQKMFTLFAVAILFAATTADSFAQLTKIWEINKNGIQSYSPNAKLAYAFPLLMDLTNGDTIAIVNGPDQIILDNSGKRYFTINKFSKTLKVYDRYTNEFIQDLVYRKYLLGKYVVNDSIMFEFEDNTGTYNFWNIYTNEIIDSYKLQSEPDEPNLTPTGDTPILKDGRYFACNTLLKSGISDIRKFIIYDRKTKEIIFSKIMPPNHDVLVQSFMHRSNQMAFGDVIKLDGDDKPYSYIRIFDLDKREIIRNVRVGEENEKVRHIVIRMDDSFILYLNTTLLYTNFYDYKNDRKLSFKITTSNTPFYIDDSLYVSEYPFSAYKIDWTTVGVEDEPNPNIPIIYPNPTTNSINLNIDEKFYNGQWQMIDLNGWDILNGIILSNPQLQIDISNLPSATYYLRLTNGKEIKVEKVVKW
ncbi:hypothetical protein MASR1M45_23050 [Candidatus Kapaibacterium sp.]